MAMQDQIIIMPTTYPARALRQIAISIQQAAAFLMTLVVRAFGRLWGQVSALNHSFCSLKPTSKLEYVKAV